MLQDQATIITEGVFGFLWTHDKNTKGYKGSVYRSVTAERALKCTHASVDSTLAAVCAVVEAEGESFFNILKQKRKRLENELAAVGDVPLSDVGVVPYDVCGGLREHQPVGSSLRAAAENKKCY
ncbi:hypothetical protein Tco_0797837 [Tanacetum coccineum]